MSVPNRFIEVGDDQSADSIQDRNPYDHSKYDLHRGIDPAQAKQRYRFGGISSVSKRRNKQQYSQKNIQRIAYERNVLIDELSLLVFCHGNHLI